MRAATYLRRSSLGEEDKNYSLDDQRDHVTRYEQAQGFVHIAEYNDPGGKSFKLNRPVFQRMLRDAKAGLFDVLVVGRWDRFSRIQDQQSVAVYQLRQYGVEVVSATQPTEKGPLGTFMRNLYGFNAELQLMTLREVVTGGRRKRIQAGKILTAPYPLYGYAWGDPERGQRSYYVADPETSPVVVRIYRDILSGKTLRGTAAGLEAEGVPTPMQVNAARGRLPRNKPMSAIWRLSTLKRILSNPAYCGRHSAWRFETITTSQIDDETGLEVDRVRVVERGDDHEDRVWFTADTCPALVSEEDWRLVQSRLAQNKQSARRNLRDPEAGLLRSGVAVCGYCGRAMQLKWSASNQHYRYFCGSERDVKSAGASCSGGAFSWTADKLDGLVWDWTKAQLSQPDLLRAAFLDWQQAQASGSALEYDQVKALDAQIKRASNRRANFLTSMADAEDEEDRQEYKQRAEAEKRSMAAWIEERERLAGAIAQQESFAEQVESVVEAAGRANANLDAASYETRRTILRAFGVKVQVKRVPDFTVAWQLVFPCTTASEHKTHGPTLVWSSDTIRRALACA